ncbi:hypothetical protein THARTR1_10616 [Trichoderma harzianum]|uniref:Uncharacterized protein n=1 Tax=Trichoderma harzianum TaxID=5544 RepID=A0A2K0TNK0_TRIHA|nr:hypothetical protein THARTR1_10616 [Trichoderma harzianum]
MDQSLKMGEPSSYTQNPPKGYIFEQKKHHHHHQQQEQQHHEGLSSSPEREAYLERRSSNDSASRRISMSRPCHSGSGFLGTMR